MTKTTTMGSKMAKKMPTKIFSLVLFMFSFVLFIFIFVLIFNLFLFIFSLTIDEELGDDEDNDDGLEDGEEDADEDLLVLLDWFGFCTKHTTGTRFLQHTRRG